MDAHDAHPDSTKRQSIPPQMSGRKYESFRGSDFRFICSTIPADIHRDLHRVRISASPGPQARDPANGGFTTGGSSSPRIQSMNSPATAQFFQILLVVRNHTSSPAGQLLGPAASGTRFSKQGGSDETCKCLQTPANKPEPVHPGEQAPMPEMILKPGDECPEILELGKRG